MAAPAAQPTRRRVIKKISGHGHHGGAWKIAYADFVTAMMALFLVLWLLASTDQSSREEIAQYFRTGILPDGELATSGGAQAIESIMPRSPAPPAPGTESIANDIQTLQESLDALVENRIELAGLADKVKVQATSDGIVIEAVDDEQSMLFDSASAELNKPLEDFLVALAPVLAARKEQIEIQGHTDARPFASGAGKTNWDLSYDRATVARRILEANGIKDNRIVGVIGRGAAVPLDAGDPYAARNRRLSVLLRSSPVGSKPKAAAGGKPGAGDKPGTGDKPAKIGGPLIRRGGD